ncbi:family 20 glycosylhydrolase [Agromyces sp. NBRC 114283]|uniref:family 20 glycosylhydrolase n=1 Tax=Agromyces sp. NBRC 114283 TaxID=2994521 RepID=UPI0024A580AA|nr:family 20 glycosylhydrolase [Agromyces sp. NBRC 114283]GLU89226.1 beta-N-acetylhexosaminidase [Agromyces sp. NBRC 114283]
MSIAARTARLLAAALSIALGSVVLAGCAPQPNGADVPRIIPAPASFEQLDAEPFRLDDTSRVLVVGDAGTAPALLAAQLRLATGAEVPVVAGSEDEAGPADVLIAVEAGAAEASVPAAPAAEAYRLTTGADGARIEAASPAGAFWASRSLLQLLPAAILSSGEAAQAARTPEGGWTAPAVRIDDAPRFAYRGAMLDVARHFLPVGDVERYVDQLAMLKLNVLHLHLTDDQGWRLQIDAWPELTGIGASTSTGGDGGGFYTKDDFRRLVAYAAERHVTIVPEVDLPGHTNAALSAYPELNCDGVAPAPYEGVEVGFSSLCAAPERAEATDRFLADVTRELAELTPGPWIHLGGDESLATSEADYLDLVRRMTSAGAATGKTIIGWHELGASPELPPGTVGQYWDYATPREETGSEADVRSFLDQGGRIVFSPADVAYLDMVYPDAPSFEGRELGQDWADGDTSLAEAYGWDPAAIVPGVGDDDILGVEAPIWTETMRTLDEVEFMAFPRILAIAEIAWSPAAPDGRDEAAFFGAVAGYGERLEAMSVPYHRMPEVPWRD